MCLTDMDSARLAKINTYLADCGQALQRFRDTSWKCEAMSGRQRCLNYYVGHEKGHQFAPLTPRLESARSPSPSSSYASTSAPSLLVGEFQCSFEPGKVIEELYSAIIGLLERGDNTETATTLVAEASGVASVSSNRTCYPCLSQCPVYMLPCDGLQHTICEQCAIRFTDTARRSQTTVCLKRCPLSCYFRRGAEWRGRIKPPTAGVRLLSLDGSVTELLQCYCFCTDYVPEEVFAVSWN